MKDKVTECGDTYCGSFLGMKELRKIRLSKNLKIMYDSFEGCSKLKKIRIPDKMKRIYSHAFQGCTSLKSITLGKNLRWIEDNAFRDCQNLRKIVFQSKVWSAARYPEAIFRDMGKKNYGKLALYVPKKWKKEKKQIREWFREAGLSKKAKIKFY